jgi:hypothetical protein
MQEEQKLVLNLISSALFEYKKDIADSQAAPISELLSQAVLPLANLQDNPEWRKLSTSIIATNMQVSYEHTELHDLLTAHSIPYVTLKGVASAAYYPNPILRTMGDVDFLISSSDIALATSLLKTIGFEKAADEDDNGIHIAFQRDDSTWEMHRSINGIPAGKSGELIKRYLDHIIETAVDYDEGNGVIRIPDDFHHGLVLLLHTASHLTSEGVGLRHLCDWAVFVNHLTDAQFTDLFEEKLKGCGLWRFAQLLSLTSVQYLKLPYQSWMGEADDGLLEQLIADIMDGGNFGHKDEDRYRQIKYISNRGEYTVDEKNPVLQLWDTIGRKAKATGTSRAAVVAEYIGMVLKGERKLDSRATVTNAAERKRLYTELHLFEP